VADRLEAAGYHVLRATNGLEALAWLEGTRPGLILLDLTMPRLDGLAALPAVRRAAPGAMVVVLTGSANRLLADDCRARGADAFVLKPLDATGLLRLAAHAFARQAEPPTR
jgi:CheY-like chemotaxis protein